MVCWHLLPTVTWHIAHALCHVICYGLTGFAHLCRVAGNTVWFHIFTFTFTFLPPAPLRLIRTLHIRRRLCFWHWHWISAKLEDKPHSMYEEAYYCRCTGCCFHSLVMDFALSGIEGVVTELVWMLDERRAKNVLNAWISVRFDLDSRPLFPIRGRPAIAKGRHS